MLVNSFSLNTHVHNQLVIAVDFDGTIVEHRYPAIGKPIPGAIETLRKIQNDGHRLILWTYRSGPKLDEAIKYCASNRLYFFAANNNFPNEILDKTLSRKIAADLFIDDRNIGGLLPWDEIYNIIKRLSNNFKEQ